MTILIAVILVAWPGDIQATGPADTLTWRIQTVDSAGQVGEYTSLALDAAGNPHISYYDGVLKYAAGQLSPGLTPTSTPTSTRTPTLTPNPQARTVQAYMAPNPPILDGNLSEWPQTGLVTLDATTADTVAGAAPTSPADSSATLRAAWDVRNLYFAIHVNDDRLIADSTDIWRDDGIELAIDGNFNRAGGDPGDHKYTLLVDGRRFDFLNPLTVGTYVTRAVAGGYDIEVSLPVTQVLVQPAFAADTWMGFTWAIRDDDDGGNWDTWLIWEGDETASHYDRFGQLYLNATPIIFPTPTPTSTPSTTPTDTATPTPAPPLFWNIECVDCPRSAIRMTDHSLRLDAAGRPHIAYGGTHLYHAWHDGATWQVETVDNTPGVGEYASLALDAAGRPHISYTGGGLKYARWTGSSWVIQTVDREGGGHTSLTLDAAGRPHISYTTGDALKYAHWTGSNWVIQTVDSGGRSSSLALDSAGNPHISYYYADTPEIRYARWTGSTWITQTVVSSFVYEYTSLALDGAGNPHIGYYRFIDAYYYLIHARWTGSGWSSQIVESIPEFTGFSLALDSNDQPYFCYYGDSWEPTSRCAYLHGSRWNYLTISDSHVGRDFSLVVGTAGKLYVSYNDLVSGELKYACWTGSAWIVETVDRIGWVSETSLNLDRAGNPHIGYWFGGQLRETHRAAGEWICQMTYTTPGRYNYLPAGNVSLELDDNDDPHLLSMIVFWGPDRPQYDVNYTRWTGSMWATEQVDYTDSGWHSSLALDGAGRPHVTYQWYAHFGPIYHNLAYSRWTGNEWTDRAIIAAEGWYNSLAIDSADHPHVSFYDDNNDDLVYIRYTGSNWITQTVDSDGDVGQFASLVLDSTDRPHISYYDATNGDLKYARWTGSAWELQTVDSAEDVGQHSSLALDVAGNPHISYYDQTNGSLKYARWVPSSTPGNSGSWSIYTIETVGRVERGTRVISLDVDANGDPHISYYSAIDAGLKYATTRPTLPTPTPTSTSSVTPTSTSSVTPTATPTATSSATLTPSSSVTPTSTSSVTPTATPTATSSATLTPSSSVTPTVTPFRLYLPILLRAFAGGW